MTQEARKARGTYRKDRDPAGEAVRTLAATPPAPAGLGPEAGARWAEVVPGLAEMGILGRVDGGTLEEYCRAFVAWRVLMARVESGDPRSLVPMIRLHREVLQPLQAALGLHYAARCRMRAPKSAGETDEVEKDMFGQGLVTIPGGRE